MADEESSYVDAPSLPATDRGLVRKISLGLLRRVHSAEAERKAKASSQEAALKQEAEGEAVVEGRTAGAPTPRTFSLPKMSRLRQFTIKGKNGNITYVDPSPPVEKTSAAAGSASSTPRAAVTAKPPAAAAVTARENGIAGRHFDRAWQKFSPEKPSEPAHPFKHAATRVPSLLTQPPTFRPDTDLTWNLYPNIGSRYPGYNSPLPSSLAKPEAYAPSQPQQARSPSWGTPRGHAIAAIGPPHHSITPHPLSPVPTIILPPTAPKSPLSPVAARLEHPYEQFSVPGHRPHTSNYRSPNVENFHSSRASSQAQGFFNVMSTVEGQRLTDSFITKQALQSQQSRAARRSRYTPTQQRSSSVGSRGRTDRKGKARKLEAIEEDCDAGSTFFSSPAASLPQRDDVPNSAPCWQEQSDPPSPDIRTDEQATEEDEIAHLLAEKEDLLRQAANVGIQLPQSIASSKSIVLSQSVGLPPMTYGRTNHPNPLASNPGPASPLFNDHPGGHHYRMADEQQPQRTPNWFPTPSIRTQPERATTPNDQATPQQQPHPSAELAARSHDLAGDETARRQAASTPPPMQHPTPRKAAVVLGLMDKSAEDVRSPASVSSQCTSLPPLAPSVWGALGDGHCNETWGGRAVSVARYGDSSGSGRDSERGGTGGESRDGDLCKWRARAAFDAS